MKTAPRWIAVLLIFAAACSSPGLAALEPGLTAVPATPLAKATLPSGTPTLFLTKSPVIGTPTIGAPPDTETPAASPTPTITPTFTASPTALVKESILVYRPEKDARQVVTVRWSGNGREILYALSPIRDEYLLKWNSFDLSTQSSHPIVSPSPAFMDEWATLGLGYPDNSILYSELMGFSSSTGKYLLFPNAGFPKVFTIPNYVYLIPAESGDHDLFLGPTIRGTVGKAYWIAHDTRVVFDYRTPTGVILYIGDVRTKMTRTLADLPGASEINTEWSVSPNENMIFLPAWGTSQIISLAGKPIYTFETPSGVENPVWARSSQAIYFWESGRDEIKRYTVGDEDIQQPVLAVKDLVIHAPVEPTWGMPFAISPDEKSIAFWHEDWIWTVRIK